MSEWLGCEAIVKQREKEQHAAALAKCASGASVELRQDSTISTDVRHGFEWRKTQASFKRSTIHIKLNQGQIWSLRFALPA